MNKLKNFFTRHLRKSTPQPTPSSFIDPVAASKKLDYVPYGGPYDMVEDIPPEERAWHPTAHRSKA